MGGVEVAGGRGRQNPKGKKAKREVAGAVAVSGKARGQHPDFIERLLFSVSFFPH